MASKDQDKVPPVPKTAAAKSAAAKTAAAAKTPRTPKAVAPTPVETPPVETSPAATEPLAPVVPVPAPQPTYVAPPAYAPPPAGPPQGLAIASLVCGIGGLLFTTFGFGFLPALAAVITGHMAQRRQPYAKSFWLTGIITGYVGLAISIVTGLVVVLAFIAFIVAGTGMYLGR